MDQPLGKVGKIKLYMTDLQRGDNGIVYKVLPADNSTTSEELIAAALERCSIIDDPKRYYICVQCKGTEAQQREIAGTEKPLVVQRRWEKMGYKIFELRVKPSQPLEVLVDLPNIPTSAHSILVHNMSTCASVVKVLTRRLGAHPTPGRRFCLVQYNRNTKVTRILKATTLPLRVKSTWQHEPNQFVLKELSLSNVTQAEESISGQSSSREVEELQLKIYQLMDENEKLRDEKNQKSVNETAELRKLKAENKRLTQELAKKKEDVSSSSTKEKGLSWYSVLSTSKVARKYEVFAVECALPSTGMGVVISKGCVIREVTDACPFRSQVQTADRLLEVNGHNVTAATPVDLKRCLQESPEHVRLVIGRPCVLDEEHSDKKLHETNDSLQNELEKERKEVKKWREMHEQHVTVSNFKSEQAKEKISVLETQVAELKEQLTESQSARDQLRLTVEELHQSYGSDRQNEETQHQQNVTLRRKVEELEAQNQALDKTYQKTNELLVTTQQQKNSLLSQIREHLVGGIPQETLSQEPSRSSQVTDGTREDVMTALEDVEGDLVRQKAYLDILLSVVMEKCPEILGMISDIQNKGRMSQGWL
jgi:hypothetical protein